MPARIIAVMSPKGGVGKTTVSVNLSSAIGALKKKVLIIDTNVDTPHVAIYFGFVGYKNSLEDVLSGAIPITEAIYKTDDANVDILPSRVFKIKGDGNARYRLINLFHQLKKIADSYDYIVLDSKPSLDVDFLRPITGAEAVIVTMPEIASVIEAKKLQDAVTSAGISVAGMILNKVNRRTIGMMDEEEVKTVLEVKNLWKVPDDSNLFDALRRGIPIVSVNRRSGASKAFMEIARDITSK